MGLLEDAIRQHLELKRRHGAPEQELERQESEALGPARREAPAPEDELAPEPSAVGEPDEAEIPAKDADETALLDPSEPEEEEAPYAPAEQAPLPEPAAPLEEGQAGPDYAAPLEEDPPAEPEYDDEEPPDAPTPGDTPARGFAAVDDEDEDEDDGSGDVLEDTPDFLQETPEHDRLWFEQKPPRDFDFD